MSNLRLLSEHHRELEARCEALRGAVHADDRRALVDAYRAFERSVLEHLRAEEEVVVPAYERFAREDAARIRLAHHDLRQQLFAIAIDVELHCVRADRLERLLEALRAHAADEDAGMYPWAAAHLPTHAKVWLVARIAHSMQALVRAERLTRRSPVRPAAAEHAIHE